MTTITELMDKVLSLPKNELRPGTPTEERVLEMKILFPLAPQLANVRRGCLPKNGSVEVHVRVNPTSFNNKYHEINIFRHNGKDVVTINGAILHASTVEEIHQYVSELCSENAH
ncbi:hypothetical protein A2392_00300 [Candidatus Kaiserbacteria bacterium RIFOXYB1_FULL_46_14]|uniref:Uncharacterized protein n=1 Tax=Candidatus Kaiserbacteria bacterium RIFOXYB1_FULL_46_14 TaxID=1798531 RepID=A0A1F6FJ21_9BACT|nr:MAG: hypothetical protein A2392_00300 [Candidatus Kaiserbacteria bacterium RIFOXYB1_FULL_46_14]